MKIKANRRLLLSWVPAVAVMGVLFHTSSLPGDETNLPLFPFSDKLIHFLAYSVLGCMISLRFVLRRRIGTIPISLHHAAAGWDWFGMSLGMAYGISDEIHQLFVPMRMFELGDMAADFLGVAAGCLGYRLMIKKPEAGVT